MSLNQDIIGASLTNSRLHLILMPTEACNFRCTYCYEDFRLNQMRPEVVWSVCELISRRAPTLQHLRLSWFGGEPLLATRLIKSVMSHAAAERLQHPQLQVQSDITTNAYKLSQELFGELLELGIHEYQIAFDGSRDVHDRKRVLANGGPTFDRIWSNLISFRDVPGDFQVTVRLHVDSENLEYLPQFIQEFQGAFVDDPRFRLFFRTLECLGGPNDAQLQVLGRESGKTAVEKLSCQADHLGARFITEKDLDAVCYACRGNSFVVRADGRLNKCTVALEDPINQVGRLLNDGRVEMDAPKINAWIKGLWSQDAAELECPKRCLADSV